VRRDYSVIRELGVKNLENRRLVGPRTLRIHYSVVTIVKVVVRSPGTATIMVAIVKTLIDHQGTLRTVIVANTMVVVNMHSTMDIKVIGNRNRDCRTRSAERPAWVARKVLYGRVFQRSRSLRYARLHSLKCPGGCRSCAMADRSGYDPSRSRHCSPSCHACLRACCGGYA
jgi:hypothetical protein